MSDVPIEGFPLSQSWQAAGDGTIRGRLVTMIASALQRTPLLGVDIIGWDFVMVPMANAMLAGVAIAIRGYDLAGPGKELMQFRPFTGWAPSQVEVDTIVGAIIDWLREARDTQGRQVNGQLLDAA